MSNSYLFPVQSRPTTDFLTALAAAGAPLTPPFVGTVVNNIPGLPNVGPKRYLIRGIEYLAVQNIGLEFDFFNSATGLTNAIGTDGFISRYQFAAANGVQFNSTGLYRYYVDGLAIPYIDLDAVNSQVPVLLHVAIQNIDIVAKSADAAGAIQATFWCEPMQAY